MKENILIGFASIALYFSLYATCFDDFKTFDRNDRIRPVFKSSPKWVEHDLFYRGRVGRPTTIWNYVFYPAEWVWYLFASD
jgi:hypothetical protein